MGWGQLQLELPPTVTPYPGVVPLAHHIIPLKATYGQLVWQSSNESTRLVLDHVGLYCS